MGEFRLLWNYSTTTNSISVEILSSARQSTNPARTANRTRSVMLCKLSFSMMRPRCASTV